MANPNPQTPYIKDSEQTILNKSFDPTFQVLATMGVEWDGGQSLYRALSDNVACRIDDTTTANTTYIGKAPIGSATSGTVWQIAKLDTSSGLTKTWADGNSSFDNIWDNRASLSYS